MANYVHMMKFGLELDSSDLDAGLGRAHKAVAKLKSSISSLSKAGGAKPGSPASGSRRKAGKVGVIGEIFTPELLSRLPSMLRRVTVASSTLGGVAASLSLTAFAVGRSWFKFNQTLDATRRKLGLTRVEFDSYVLSTAKAQAKFGANIKSSDEILRTMGAGLDITNPRLIDMAGYMALVGEVTSTTEKDISRFGEDMLRFFDQGVDGTEKITSGILTMTRAVGVHFGETISVLSNARGLIEAMSKERGAGGVPGVVKTLGTMEAKFRQVGLRVEDVSRIFNALEGDQSKLFKQFKVNSFDLENMSLLFGRLAEAQETGAISAIKINKVWDDLGIGVLRKMSEALKDTGKAQQEFDRGFGMDAEERKKDLQDQSGILHRLQQNWSKFWGSQTAAIHGLLSGPMRDLGEWLIWYSDHWVKGFGMVTEWIGKKLFQAWEGFYTFIQHFGIGLWNLYKKIEEKVKSFVGYVKTIPGINVILGDEEETAADKKLKLINPHAKTLAKMGYTHSQANMIAEAELIRQGLPRPGIGTTVPAPEVPEAVDSAAVGLQSQMLDELKKIREQQEKQSQRDELDRAGYKIPPQPGGGGSSRAGSPSQLELQRS